LKEFYSIPFFQPFNQTDLYIFGESYGGKYVPSIARLVSQKNELNLKGIGIVDGFTHPLKITQELGMMAYSLGMLDA